MPSLCIRRKMRTKAEFRALRQMVGYTQSQIAHMLNIDGSTVRRWERADMEWQPTKEAWKLLDDARSRQVTTLKKAYSILKDSGTKNVILPIYRTAEEYALTHPGNGQEFSRVNANNLQLASFVMIEGYSVEWVFGSSGKWQKIAEEAKNHQELI